jgi:hypothetical protein
MTEELLPLKLVCRRKQGLFPNIRFDEVSKTGELLTVYPILLEYL